MYYNYKSILIRVNNIRDNNKELIKGAYIKPLNILTLVMYDMPETGKWRASSLFGRASVCGTERCEFNPHLALRKSLTFLSECVILGEN